MKRGITIAEAVIDDKPTKWESPYSGQGPHEFYFSFPHMNKGKADEMSVIDSGRKEWIREAMREVSKFANVRMQETGEAPSSDERNIFFIPFTENLRTTGIIYMEELGAIDVNMPLLDWRGNIVPVEISWDGQMRGDQPKSQPVNGRIIYLTRGLLEEATKEVVIQNVIREVFEVFGLKSPCRDVSSSKAEKCEEQFRPYTIMVNHPEVDLDACFEKVLGSNYKEKHRERPYKSSQFTKAQKVCASSPETSSPTENDIKALEQLFGPVSPVRNATSTNTATGKPSKKANISVPVEEFSVRRDNKQFASGTLVTSKINNAANVPKIASPSSVVSNAQTQDIGLAMLGTITVAGVAVGATVGYAARKLGLSEKTTWAIGGAGTTALMALGGPENILPSTVVAIATLAGIGLSNAAAQRVR